MCRCASCFPVVFVRETEIEIDADGDADCVAAGCAAGRHADAGDGNCFDATVPLPGRATLMTLDSWKCPMAVNRPEAGMDAEVVAVPSKDPPSRASTLKLSRLAKHSSSSSRRMLRHNLEDAILEHRQLQPHRKLKYDPLALPTCMPLAGSTCALNGAYLLEVMDSFENLTFPQLLFTQEAAAAVLCPDLWEAGTCKEHPYCKWEPSYMWCDVDPLYAQVNMYCEGSQAKQYYQCNMITDQIECTVKPDCFYLPSGNISVPGDCYPQFLELLQVPLNPDIYGCCPGMDLVTRTHECGAFKGQETCEKSLGDECIWDTFQEVCNTNPVSLIIDIFGPNVSSLLQDGSDACAAFPLSQCQSKAKSFPRPEDVLLDQVLGEPLNNTARKCLPNYNDSIPVYGPAYGSPAVYPPAYPPPEKTKAPPSTLKGPKGPPTAQGPKGPPKAPNNNNNNGKP
eukprot:gene11681-34406_t